MARYVFVIVLRVEYLGVYLSCSLYRLCEAFLPGDVRYVYQVFRYFEGFAPVQRKGATSMFYSRLVV